MATPVALVTGAAHRIGARIARRLHQEGYDVIVHYHHSEEQARALVEELNRQRANSAICLYADLVVPDQVRRLAADALARRPGLRLLVNNASRFYRTPLDQARDEDWDQLMHSNLRAPFLLSQALAPTLTHHHGAIINLVDIYAEKPLREHPLYSMAKAGLAMMTRSLARELGPEVRVNGIAPGAILWPEQGQETQQAILDALPLGRAGNADDIANTVVWLADHAPYITGQIIAVDGGRSQSFPGA